jgi:hypothetical protein
MASISDEGEPLDIPDNVTNEGAPLGSAGTSAGSNYGGAVATGVGGLATAYATYESGRAQKRLAAFNARYAKMQSEQALQAGEFAANRVAEHTRQVEAAGRAAAAGSGVVAGAGSQRYIAASNEAAGAMDQLMIDLNARRQAYGYQVKAQADTIEGRMAGSAANVTAAQTLLNTGSRLWMQSDQSHSIEFA